MIAFVQPFGINDPGGGPRILRALLEDAPQEYISICTSHKPPDNIHDREIHLPSRPHFGRIESTRLRKYLQLDRLDVLRADSFKRKLVKVFREASVSVVHAIPHGIDFWYAFEVASALGIPYVLNVHDDLEYNIGERPYYQTARTRFEQVWREAHHRFVISDAMGEAYSSQIANRPYDVVTDGLKPAAIAAQTSEVSDKLTFYFMGSMHLTYHENVRSLFEAIDTFNADEATFVIRGSRCPVESPKSLQIDERPFAAEDIVRSDFQEVDILYLPLPFGKEHESFVRYSFSTKLISYLGSGVPILYHGPGYAAVAKILSDNGAAAFASSIEAKEVWHAVKKIKHNGNSISDNALKLAARRFDMRKIKSVFWGALGDVCGLPRP